MSRRESLVSVSTADLPSAVLGIDGLKLLLPQNELRTLEPLEDVKHVSQEHLEVGWISIADQQWPVFCVSGDLSIMGEIPKQRRIAVMLGTGNEMTGILCDEIKFVGSEDLSVCPLPMSLRLPSSPLTDLVIYGDTVGCMTSSHNLISYLRQ